MNSFIFFCHKLTLVVLIELSFCTSTLQQLRFKIFEKFYQHKQITATTKKKESLIWLHNGYRMIHSIRKREMRWRKLRWESEIGEMKHLPWLEWDHKKLNCWKSKFFSPNVNIKWNIEIDFCIRKFLEKWFINECWLITRFYFSSIKNCSLFALIYLIKYFI